MIAERSDLLVPPASIVEDLRLEGLQIDVGFGGDEANSVVRVVTRLDAKTRGLAILHSADSLEPEVIADLLRQAWGQSGQPQQAGVHFVSALDAERQCDAVFVGFWRPACRELTYFAAGFRPPTVFSRAWPHLSESGIDRPTPNGPQTISFGERVMAAGERWLLATPALVDVPDPVHQPFNAVGLIQYAYDERGMAADCWTDYLLGRALTAHRDVLPAGAILLALTCAVPQMITPPSPPGPALQRPRRP